MSYGNTFKVWREYAALDWVSYTRHAFVKGLGDGTLPREAFLKYLVQDYIFLIHFSRAWALAVTKSETIEEMRLAASTVNALINEEIGLHIRICAEAGISEVDLFNAEEMPENIAYTRYVLDAGHSGDLLDLLAALAPCIMGYGEIGMYLSTNKSSNKYSDWISTYACEEYQEVCKDVGALIDNAIIRRIGNIPQNAPRWNGLCCRFQMATKLEVGFWNMGLDL